MAVPWWWVCWGWCWCWLWPLYWYLLLRGVDGLGVEGEVSDCVQEGCNCWAAFRVIGPTTLNQPFIPRRTVQQLRGSGGGDGSRALALHHCQSDLTTCHAVERVTAGQ